MESKYVITNIKNKTAGFYIKNGKPEAINCYQEDSLVGNIYMGRISNIVENIGAIFVDIDNNDSCYLSMEDYIVEKKPRINDIILVQVVKDKIKTKQPTVTTNISITGDNIIVQINGVVGASNKIKGCSEKENKKKYIKQVIQEFNENKKSLNINYGAIIRTEGFQVSEDVLKQETIKLLCKLDEIIHLSNYSRAYSCLFRRNPQYVADALYYNRIDNAEIITDLEYAYNSIKEINDISEEIQLYRDDSISLASLYNLNSTVDKLLAKKAFLKSGAYLVIEPTEAMIVIDVNSGKAIKGKDSETAILKINLEAANEIARQLKLRNLSGMILIDFISMKDNENNIILLEELKKAVLNDRVPVNVVDITKLGIVELTRKKLHKPIYEVFQ